MDQLNVAVIGYGLAGAVFHAPLIAAEPRMRVAAVVTGSAERAAQAEAEHPGVRVLPDADALFESADGRIDLVVVAAPNDAHAPLTRSALAAGLPVVIDKPATPTAAETRELIALADRAGLALSVFQNRRWDGDFLTARKLIEQGDLGDVARFESRFERWRPVPKGGWRETGGRDQAAGLLFDLGSHLVDQALTLFGPAVSVYAQLDARRPGIDTDDDAFVALTHVSGVRSHLWMSAVTAQLGPRMRVLGSKGAYVKYGLDVQEDALRTGARPGDAAWGEDAEAAWGTVGTDESPRKVETEHGAYEAYYAGMAAAILDGAPVPVDPRESASALDILEAARWSAEQNTVVLL
ncbi:MAG TPA: Gfo/Idh/MocA family oxidoreductase [Actinocrinis sp.]|nr:Gfo/Idh/MocA family oxidoreductase [Actinocrinis sp.]